MNIASYRDLPTGRYTLMVKASGSGTAIRLPVVVEPPLWATPWAIALYIIAAAAVAFTAFSHLRTVYRLRRDIAMEKRLTDFKIKFFTDISHEFRTPLTLIRGNVDAMRQSADFPKALKQSADSLKRNTDRMMRLINQLLEFRRMEEDKLQPSLEETDIVAFLRAIADSFHDAAGVCHSMQSVPLYVPFDGSRVPGSLSLPFSGRQSTRVAKRNTSGEEASRTRWPGAGSLTIRPPLPTSAHLICLVP